MYNGKVRGQAKVSRVHPLGALNVCTKFHSNPSSSDIATSYTYNRKAGKALIAINLVRIVTQKTMEACSKCSLHFYTPNCGAVRADYLPQWILSSYSRLLFN